MLPTQNISAMSIVRVPCIGVCGGELWLSMLIYPEWGFAESFQQIVHLFLMCELVWVVQGDGAHCVLCASVCSHVVFYASGV